MNFSKKLSRLHKKSDAAINVFTTVEQSLSESNMSLDSLIDELETEMSKISATWQQAKGLKKMNDAIRQRITEIITTQSN
jgi:phage shock protein A